MNKLSRVVIDSCIWIDYFKGGKVSSLVDDLLLDNKATICGMIELEILQGVRPKEQMKIQDLFEALHFIESKREDFISAGLLLNKLRTKGITIPASDCLIAAQCIREDLPLLTLDNDFKNIHELQQIEITKPLNA